MADTKLSELKPVLGLRAMVAERGTLNSRQLAEIAEVCGSVAAQQLPEAVLNLSVAVRLLATHLAELEFERGNNP